MTGWQQDPLKGASDDTRASRPFQGADEIEEGSVVRQRPRMSSEPATRVRLVGELRRRWVNLGGRIDRFVEGLGLLELDGALHLGALRGRAHDFGEVREALYQVQLDVGEPALEPLLGEDGSISPFLTGLYIWCEDSIDALERAAHITDTWAPGVLRARLEHAAQYYFDGLIPRLRDDIDALRIVDPQTCPALEALTEHLEELFFAARWLHQKLVASAHASS